MDETPPVSVVIPTFNCARFISRALASVATQTLRPVEIIVVDDGSTDDTRGAISSSGVPVRYVWQSNAGPSAARNRGIAESGGELISFLDADDEWLPPALERMTRVLIERPGVGLVSADMSAIDEAGRLTQESWLRRRGILDDFARLGDRPITNPVGRLMAVNFVSTSLVTIRRSMLEDVGGFREDIRFGEDLELWARIAARCDVVCLPVVLGLRRTHATNSTRSTEPMLLDLIRVSESVRSWGKEALARQGVDADRLVAQAWERLGYWYFSNDRFAASRKAFRNALREKPGMRSLSYLMLSQFPVAVIAGGRRAKRFLAERGEHVS